MGILVIASLPFILGGCENSEEYEIKPITIETIEPASTPSQHIQNPWEFIKYGGQIVERLEDYNIDARTELIDVLTSVRFSNSALVVSKSPKFTSYLMKGNFLAMVIHKLKGIVFMMILC